MVNAVTPIWYLTQPCPVCGQARRSFWLRVRNVSMSRQNAPKRGPVSPTHGESMPTRKAIRRRCYVRLVIPCRLRSSCLRRLNKFKRRDSAARRTRRASSKTSTVSNIGRGFTQINAD